MPRLIQSQARGLLSLLTSKDGGIGPGTLEDSLRATVDTSDFYLLNGRTTTFNAQTAAQADAAPSGWIAAGGALDNGWRACYPGDGNLAAGVPAIAVPEGELWRVKSVTIQVDRVTGGSGQVFAGWAHGMFPNFRYSQIGNASTTFVANQATTCGGQCDFLALPGSCAAFFNITWDLGVNDYDFQVYVVYERLPL